MDKVGKAPGRNGFQQRRYFQGIDAGASRQTERGDGRIGAKTTGTIEDGNGRRAAFWAQVVLYPIRASRRWSRWPFRRFWMRSSAMLRLKKWLPSGGLSEAPVRNRRGNPRRIHPSNPVWSAFPAAHRQSPGFRPRLSLHIVIFLWPSMKARRKSYESCPFK